MTADKWVLPIHLGYVPFEQAPPTKEVQNLFISLLLLF